MTPATKSWLTQLDDQIRAHALHDGHQRQRRRYKRKRSIRLQASTDAR
jgi:hypothetical protein